MAQDVKASGFTLKVRNSDRTQGTSDYFWMAVCEKPTIGPDGAPQPPPQLHMGIVQPRAFAQSGDFPHLDWQQWRHVPFRSAFRAKKDEIAVVASSYNINSVISAPFFLQNSSQSPAVYVHSTPVAVVQDVTPQSFTLSARNSDVMPGFCAYAWLALAPFSTDRPPSPDLVIDSGVSCVSKYALTGTPGDTFRQEIYFSGSFLTPPLVFVLANDGQGQVPNPEKCRRRRHGPEHHPLRIHPGRPELRLQGRRGFPRLLPGWASAARHDIDHRGAVWQGRQSST